MKNKENIKQISARVRLPWASPPELGPRQSRAGHDTSILHHAFISIFIALWDVITRYVTILMPILSFYKVYIRRENAGSCNSRLEKEQILETYPAQLQKF